MPPLPTPGSPWIMDNPPSHFLIVLYLSPLIPSSGPEIIMSFPVLISVYFLSSNITQNQCSPTRSCIHTITSSYILLLIPTIFFSIISPTFSITMDPTPIFFLLHFASVYGEIACLSINRATLCFWFIVLDFFAKTHKPKKMVRLSDTLYYLPN